MPTFRVLLTRLEHGTGHVGGQGDGALGSVGRPSHVYRWRSRNTGANHWQDSHSASATSMRVSKP